MRAPRCKRCYHIVRWITMLETGQRVAVNPDPDHDFGTIALDPRGRGQQLTHSEAATLRGFLGEDTYRRHAETCTGPPPGYRTSADEPGA